MSGSTWAAFINMEGKFCTLKAALPVCPFQIITLLLPLPTLTPSALEINGGQGKMKIKFLTMFLRDNS